MSGKFRKSKGSESMKSGKTGAERSGSVSRVVSREMADGNGGGGRDEGAVIEAEDDDDEGPGTTVPDAGRWWW